MKAKIALASLAIPLGAAAYIAFYPGPAFATSRLAKIAPANRIQDTGSYSVDKYHTAAYFEVGHLGVSKVRGRFADVSGHLVDSTDLSKAHVEFSAKTESVDTGVAPRDHHLKTSDFFDVEKYPALTFKSTSIKKDGDHYVAEGDLTIRDVTKSVSIPFHHFGPIKDPFGNTRIGIVSDPIKIDRMDYHIAWDAKLPDGSPQVGHEVTIELSLEATQDKAQ